MSDFLTAVKTVPLRTGTASEEPVIVKVASSPAELEERKASSAISGPRDALHVLRSHPDEDTLLDTLQYLTRQWNGDFSLKVPSPVSAQIINELVATIIPDFWGSTTSDVKRPLLDCLKGVSGIGAILARLKLLIPRLQAKKQGLQSQDAAQPVTQLVAVLSELLGEDHLVQGVWKDGGGFAKNQQQRRLLWKEFLGLVASGRVVSVVAEAEDALKSIKSDSPPSWLSAGAAYSAWLGRNIATMAQAVGQQDEEACRAASQLCGKSFGIGYPGRVVEEIHVMLTLHESGSLSTVQSLAAHLTGHEQRIFLEHTTRFMTQRCVSLQQQETSPEALRGSPTQIAGASALLSGLTTNNTFLTEKLIAWLTDPSMNASEPFAIRRAALAALAHDEERMQDIMEKSMQNFGTALFIKHAPILQQEAVAQVLLMACGYVHRKQPMFLFTLARSSIHLNAISNRMHASSLRARFLGLVAGMAISELVDKPGHRMTFDLEEIRTEEAKWYLQLTYVNDTVGDYSAIMAAFSPRNDLAIRSATQGKKTTHGKVKMPKVSEEVKPSQTQVIGPKIVEVLDASDEDDDLIPYDKPDSDPEDDDEDPTLVNRNKPRALVYIRDLIAGLHDTENYDHYKLALTNAAPLIRRKSQFGKEVSDHALVLASTLTGLGDPFDIDNFQELRLQALIALLLSDPANLAPWFARQVFDGDYSMSQRATLLSVLGLGARELAGFKDDDELNPSVTSSNFPSKQLPERLHKLYAQGQTPVQSLASGLERSMIQPMALRAADDVSGPNILKVRTFSSRMEVEKKRKKAIPNALAKVVAEGFFFPLTGRWWQTTQAYGRAGQNVHFQPFLLSTYIKTLALLLHASGSGTLSLPQMTAEFWDLLLGIRTHAVGDVTVMEAVLFAFLTLLEVNEDKRRVAEEHSKQLIETQEWVEMVFERTAGGDEEGEKVRMLAAGVLMKTREVVEKFQRLLMGDMLDY